MSDFYTHKPVPTWRLIIYGFTAASGVAALGIYEHDKRLYIAAIICGAFVGAFGFGLSWIRANVTPIPGENGHPARYRRWLWWLLAGGLLVTSILKLSDILSRR